MPIPAPELEKSIGTWFSNKKEKIVTANIRAFAWGRIVGELDQSLSCTSRVNQRVITAFIDSLEPATLGAALEKSSEWSEILSGKTVTEFRAGPLDGSVPQPYLSG
jgi:hypothetical protein